MARRTGSKNELIQCPYCGEKYSVTYKHCPFCNEDGTGRWDDPAPEEEYYEEEPAPVKGGKRLITGGNGGPSLGRIIGTVLSLALIIAAVCIVVSLVRSLLKRNETPTPDTTPSAPVESVVPSADPSEEPTTDPSEEPGTDTTVPPAPSTPAVEIVAPTSFTLNREDFTLDHAGEIFQMKATYTPADARGDITWKSSDPNVASVSWNGLVTAVSQGTVTITATVAGVGSKECIVRCNFKSTNTSTSTPAPSQAPSTSSDPSQANGLKLNRSDFTLASAGESWRLTVSGTSSTPTWSSSNTNVATVGADGTVKAVGKGTCQVSATVDGVTLTCIVRCTW